MFRSKVHFKFQQSNERETERGGWGNVVSFFSPFSFLIFDIDRFYEFVLWIWSPFSSVQVCFEALSSFHLGIVFLSEHDRRLQCRALGRLCFENSSFFAPSGCHVISPSQSWRDSVAAGRSKGIYTCLDLNPRLYYIQSSVLIIKRGRYI